MAVISRWASVLLVAAGFGCTVDTGPRRTASAARSQSSADRPTNGGGSPDATRDSDNPSRSCGVVTGFELRPGAVGALRVGDDVARARRECDVVRDTTQLGDEAMPERVLTVRTTRGPVDVVLDGSTINRITAAVATIRTSDSLGVGSPVGRPLRAAGARGFEGERGLFVVPGGSCGLSFHLVHDVPDAEHRNVWTTAHLAQLPPTTAVDEVLATTCSS